MSRRRTGVTWVWATLSVFVVGAAIATTFVLGSRHSVEMDESQLVGTWKAQGNPSVIEFTADGTANLTNFVYYPGVGRTPIKDLNRHGDWSLLQDPDSVLIILAEPIGSISGISFEAVNCGTDTCLSFPIDEGNSVTYHYQSRE